MRRLMTAIVLTVVWVQLAAAQTIREIAQLPAASAISASDSIACQQGGVGTAYTRCTPGAILSAGLPGAFSTLAASSNATITGRLTVGSGAPITGGSRIFDAGYSATAWLMDMQRAGSNAAGARYGALKVSQQITHDGAGSAGTPGAVASLYSSLQVNGQPTTDYWAAGFLTYVTNLADSGATPGQSQHGAMYNQSVRTLDNVAGGTIPPGRQMAEMWGQWQVLSDRTGLKSSEGNSMVGMEFDWDGNNADDGGSRYGYQMVINTYLKNATSTNPFEVKYGWYMNSGTGGVNDAFFNIPLAIYPGYTVAGIDLSQGTGPRANPYIDGTNRAVAIKLADSRAVSWDGGDLTTGAILVHGSSKLSYKKATVEQFSVSDTGTVVAAAASSGPITISSNSIAAASGQNVFISTGGYGNSWSIGNATLGLGAGLSVTSQSDGNRLFGASPNTVLAANRLTFATARMSGSIYALNGTVTPTAFSGTGSTATVTFAAISGIIIPVNSEIVISGASPSAYNGTWVVTSSTTTTVSFASTATGSLVTAGSMAYYMAIPSPFQMTANWSGTAASTQQHVPFRFQAATDTSDTGVTNQGMPILRIDHNWGGAAKGGKGGLQVQITQTSATNDPPDGIHPSQQHVALAAFANAAYNAGGTGTFANAAGNLYGMNPQVLLQGGATYWRSVNALGEVNLGVTGTSVPITLGGTVTAGDVLTIQFASADISGSPVSVSWTTGTSQTLAMIANNLEAAINNNTALSNAKISAVSRSGVITIYYPTHIAALTITPSVSGGATETMTLGSVTAGASVDLKLMGSMIRLSSDTGPASLNSAFLMLGSQSNASRSGMFNYGIVFGGMAYFNSGWSWNANSTLIAANLQDGLGNAGKSGLLTPNLAGYGVDFRQVSFTNAAWRSPGFERAPSGSSIIGGYTISGDSGGLKLDTSTGKSATSVALASGGGGGAGVATNNYFVGDVGFAYGGVFVVDTVNTSTGAVATFTTVVPPYYTGSAPTNPVSVSGGSGAGWTVNITWPSAPVVQLQASGGDTVVGSGSAILTTATSGFLRIPTMAGTPTGVVAAGSLVYNTSAGKVCVSAGGGTWTDVVGGSC